MRSRTAGEFGCNLAWEWPGTSRGIGAVEIGASPSLEKLKVYVIARSPGHPDVCSEPKDAIPPPFDGIGPPGPAEFLAYAAAPLPKGGTTASMYVFYRFDNGGLASGVRCEIWHAPHDGVDADWRRSCDGSPCLIADLPLKASLSCTFHIYWHPGDWGFPAPMLNVTLDF